tara:strand:- start:265 stop:903 length:639 start_codon:yes stop_codon:yes gene_type:complete
MNIKTLPKIIINKYIQWKNKKYINKKKLYLSAANNKQKPIAMIISCCDSRVQVTSILGGEVGDYFIHQNIANVVPNYKNYTSYDSTFSAIEYAIKSLKIKHIIVLGHSNCGGVEYGYQISKKKSAKNLRYLSDWLKSNKSIYKYSGSNEFEKNKSIYFERENIKNSINNLMSIPFIKKESKNKLNVHGLWYDIATGDLLQLNHKTGLFYKIC